MASVTGNEMVPGLFAELYDGADFGRVKEAKLVKRVRVAFERPASSLGTVLPMSFKWSGLLVVPPGGISVRFMVQSHGTAELSLDNNLLVSAHADANGKIVQPGVTTMSEGVHHVELKVSRIRYAGGQETVGLSWQPTGEEMQSVPSTVFSHLRRDELEMLKVASQSEAKKARRKGTVQPPSDAELAEGRKRVKAKFATLYADTTPIVRQSLARKLGDEAGASSDATEHYALLREAADVSAGAGDIKGAMLCVDAIVSEFKVDEPELELAVLSSGMHTKVPAAYHELGEAAMQVADDASAADELETAFRAASLAETAFGAGKDEELPRAKARAKDLRDLQQQFARIAPLIKKLHDDPNDADANTKAGRFFCLSAGRWEKGLPMLAKGSDLSLKALAEAEASSPADADAQLKLGDGWWDRAATESSSSAPRCKERACFWYLQVRAANSAALPERDLQRLATLSRTIDLLPLIDPDALTNGGWKREHGALVSSDMFGTTLELPYQPVGDFDFIVEYTPTRGEGNFVQGFPANNTRLNWKVGSLFANFDPVFRRPGSYGPMLRGAIQYQLGHRYTSVVQYRRSGVRGIVNGVLLREWATDYSEVPNTLGSRMVNGVIVRDSGKSLCISCQAVDVVITAIRVVEVPRSVK
ncbi:MAG TPA: hypothetical protein VG269_01205 [Tepidisphaeraceae bacterium]|nr:hypothetical protein [Tepidisphaeraceae bacterium]